MAVVKKTSGMGKSSSHGNSLALRPVKNWVHWVLAMISKMGTVGTGIMISMRDK